MSITGDRKRALSAGKESTLECRCQGSRPRPLFRWFIDNRELEVASESSENSDNGEEWTSSVIKFVAKPEDNGKYIVCKATNEYFPDLVKEDGYIINVHCKFDNKLTRRNLFSFPEKLSEIMTVCMLTDHVRGKKSIGFFL